MRDYYGGYSGRGGGSRRGAYGRGYSQSHARSYPYPAPKPQLSEPCSIYTRTGRCEQGAACRYRHDPNHVALCQPYFMKGRCSTPGNLRCHLSHTPQPQNTPMCVHFARGRCEKENCRFTHMANLGDRGNDIEVCRNFAMVGWCEKGASCNRRHSFNCPDFDAHGKCSNPNCKLQHVIKAEHARPLPPAASSKYPKGTRETVNLDSFVEFLSTFDGSRTFRAPRASLSHDSFEVSNGNQEPSPLDASAEAANESDSDPEHEFDFVESMNAARENHESINTNADFISV